MAIGIALGTKARGEGKWVRGGSAKYPCCSDPQWDETAECCTNCATVEIWMPAKAAKARTRLDKPQ